MKKIIAFTAFSITFAFISFLLRPDYKKKSLRGELVFPSLFKQIDNIKSLKIRSSKGDVNILKDDNNNFIIKELNGYHANEKRVKEILLSSANLEIYEEKNVTHDKLKDLKLEDVSSDSKSYRLEIFNKADDKIFDLILGISKVGIAGFSNGIFIRKPNENKVFIARKSFDITGDALSFVNNVIIDLKEDDVKSVTINQNDIIYKIEDKVKYKKIFNFFDELEFYDVKIDEGQIPFASYEYEIYGGVKIIVQKLDIKGENPHIKIKVTKQKAVTELALKTYEELSKLEGWLFKVSAVKLSYLLEVRK
ncbi:MAG: hypothetical protein BWY78_01174 [Alphaproteobacteria bacterium ADurb.Bin438]|nr:MAG: hypothetical protein BWY78_01174 [Alphaproteobacteria bacterium ADurb.Bin438]